MNDLTKMKIIVVLLSATTLITTMNLNRFQKVVIEYHECNNRIVANQNEINSILDKRIERLEDMETKRQSAHEKDSQEVI